MAKNKHQERKEAKRRKKAEASEARALVKRPLWVILPILCGFIAFSSIYENEYINYDDDVYVTDNVPLRTMDTGELFGEFYLNQYSPLAMSMMGFVFEASSADSATIRTYTLIIHLLCAVLVFLVFRELFKNDIAAALLASLFAVHPMQVESVAWLAAAMKIGTYSAFFLASLWLYLRFLKKQKNTLYVGSFILFVLACLCKEQAVVLPIVLVLVDYLKGGSLFSKKTWVNKIPFLVISIIFGVLTLQASGGDELSQRVFDFSLSERVLFAFYSIGMYIAKLIVPHDLSFFYTYPVKGDIPSYFYVFPLVVIALLFAIYKAYVKEKRYLVFGLLFFLVNIALTTLTAIMSVRDIIMADRYVYLAMLGIFFCLIQFLSEKKDTWGSWSVYAPLFLVFVYLIGARQRVPVFHDSISLFTDVIEKESYDDKENPYLALPYNNRGIALKRAGQRDKAMRDYETAITCNPNYPNGHLNRGNLYFDAGKDDEALSAYDKVIQLKPDNAKARSARGAIYAKQKQYEKAMTDLNEAIRIDKYFIDAYSNRALTFLDMGQTEDAIADVSSILTFSPSRDDMYEFRGYLYTQAQDYQAAERDLTKAIQLSPSKASYYYNRAVAYQGLNDVARAKQDANRARTLGYAVPQSFYDALR